MSDSSVHPFLSTDVTTRLPALQKSLADKAAIRPKVDSQGRPVGPVRLYEYDAFGQLIGPAEDTE